MNNFTTQFYDLLIKNNNNFELACAEIIRSNLELAINEILQSELTAVLEYEKYERTNKNNSRNGCYHRDFNTAYGVLNIRVPRDRNNEFQSQIIPKYGRHDKTTEEIIMRLFQTGLTNEEISKVVDDLYAKKYSRGTISNITNHFIETVDAFKKRKIDEHYAVIYTDATYVSLRRGTVSKEAVYIVLGITPDGKKEVLGYRIAPTENCEVWKELLLDLKERGLKSANIFCTDGLKGITDVIEELFDCPRIQRCLIHITRNIYSKVKPCERKEVCNDFKNVYRQNNKVSAQAELLKFIDKWKRYPAIKNSLLNNTYIFTYYDFPEEIWKTISNTNIIEGFNRAIKRMTDHKVQFPNEEALEKVLVTVFEDYNLKNFTKIHQNFGILPPETWKE